MPPVQAWRLEVDETLWGEERVRRPAGEHNGTLMRRIRMLVGRREGEEMSFYYMDPHVCCINLGVVV